MGRRLQVAGVFFVPAHDDLGCLACYSVHASACTGGSACRVCGSAGDRGRSGIASRTALLLGRRKRARANHGSGGSGCGGNTVGFDCTGLAICAVYQGTGISGLAHDGDGDLWAAKGTMITDRVATAAGDIVFFGGSFSSFERSAIYARGGMVWDADDFNVPVQDRTLAWIEHGLPFVGAVRFAGSGGGSSGRLPDESLVRTPDGGILRIAGRRSTSYLPLRLRQPLRRRRQRCEP